MYGTEAYLTFHEHQVLFGDDLYSRTAQNNSKVFGLINQDGTAPVNVPAIV